MKKKLVLIILLVVNIVAVSVLGYFYISNRQLFDKEKLIPQVYINRSEIPEPATALSEELLKVELPGKFEIVANSSVNRIVAENNSIEVKSGLDRNTINVTESPELKTVEVNGLSLNRDSEYRFNFEMNAEKNSKVRIVIYDEDYERTFLETSYVCNSGNQTFHFNTGSYITYTSAIRLYFSDIGEYSIDNLNFSSDSKQYKVKVNQLGYTSQMQKIACFSEYDGSYFEVVDADNGEIVYKGPISHQVYDEQAEELVSYGDFSEIRETGKYFIKSQYGNYSYDFEIRDDVYENLVGDVLKMISSQRCGYDLPVAVYGEFGHPACHESSIEAIDLGFEFDAPGGWHDAGDYGRYTSTINKTAIELMMAYMMNPGLYNDDMGILESANDISDILDEIKVATDYLMRIQLANGEVFEKVITKSFAAWVVPNDDTGKLFAFPPTTAATAYSAGVLMLASELYQDIDPAYAAKCRNSAEKAYNSIIDSNYVGGRKIKDFSNNGDYIDTEDISERYFMNMIFGLVLEENEYFRLASDMASENDFEMFGMDYNNPSAFASYLFVKRYDSDEFSDLKLELYQKMLLKANKITETSYGNGYLNSNSKYGWGTNYQVANAGALLGFAYDISGNQVYLDNACNQLHYILGNNTLNRSYVTGYGSISPQNIHHRQSSVIGITIPGAMVGGPNYFREINEGISNEDEVAPAKNYVDDQNSYSTNEVAIYYNSSLQLLLSVVN